VKFGLAEQGDLDEELVPRGGMKRWWSVFKVSYGKF
jgi:hypothetical protein